MNYGNPPQVSAHSHPGSDICPGSERLSLSTACATPREIRAQYLKRRQGAIFKAREVLGRPGVESLNQQGIDVFCFEPENGRYDLVFRREAKTAHRVLTGEMDSQRLCEMMEEVVNDL